MPDVAKLAGVGVGTVYRHFPTKDDLIAALVGEASSAWPRRRASAWSWRTRGTGISEFIRFSAQIQAGDRGLCEITGCAPT